MTLNGHFTFSFQFSLLQTAFRRLGYILIIELFIEYSLYDLRHLTSKRVEADSESAILRIVRLRERIADLS